MEELENCIYYNVKLNINTVKEMATKLYLFDNVDIDAIQGKYLIDAKSVMGIFSLDLTRSITLRIHKSSISDEQIKELEDIIRPCII